MKFNFNVKLIVEISHGILSYSVTNKHNHIATFKNVKF